MILLDTNGHPLDIPETLRQMPNHQVGFFLLSPSFVACHVLFDLKLLRSEHSVYNIKSNKGDDSCAVPFTYLISVILVALLLPTQYCCVDENVFFIYIIGCIQIRKQI